MSFDVLHIEQDLAGKINFTPSADLPEAGNAGLDEQSAAIRQAVESDFARHGRARSDEGHIADQNIVELRQLIEGKLPQPLADFGNAGIIGDFESDSLSVLVSSQQRGQPLLGIQAHRAELVHLELASKSAYTGLREQNQAHILTYY